MLETVFMDSTWIHYHNFLRRWSTVLVIMYVIENCLSIEVHTPSITSHISDPLPNHHSYSAIGSLMKVNS